MDTSDVVVVGGGAVGCAVAYFLAKEGASVQLIEREAIGSGASAHATGRCDALSEHVEPGPYSQLLVESTRLLKGLAPGLAQETGIDLLYQEKLSMRVAFTPQEAEYLKAQVTSSHLVGAQARWLERKEALEMEPRLGPGVLGGLVAQGAVQMDSYRLTLALAQAAEKLGVRVLLREVLGLEREGSRVIAVRLRNDRIPCRTVVLAMGVTSAAAGKWLGFPVPVHPLKGQSVRLRFDGAPPKVLLASARWGHLIARRDGLWSAGSTEEDVGYDDKPTAQGRDYILGWVLRVLPCLEAAKVVQHLSGLRPLSPDNRPIIGPVPGWEGVYLATGHGRKGIHLSPVTGRLIADLLAGRPPTVPVEPFLPARFAPVEGVASDGAGPPRG
ncbi:MAG: FAD-dependent oxidoreductase [Chloroflexi bacterium]|nr:FAD-dependent oxidoreductase [Chloroflexota bacterium]